VLSLIRRKLQPSARLTNQREANKIGAALQAGATGTNAADNKHGYYSGVCHNGKVIFDGKPSLGPCSTNIFPVKKEMADGLSVLFSTRDVSSL
jgi:hypothetical protein